MNWLEARIPPLLLVLLCTLLIWWLALYSPGIPLDSAYLLIIAAPLLVFGLWFCIAALIAFRRHQTTVDPMNPDNASALVDQGVFAVSRNPMYVAFTAWLAAWALVQGVWLGLAVVALFVLYLDRFQIRPEERALMRQFGKKFDRYRTRVRRWL